MTNLSTVDEDLIYDMITLWHYRLIIIMIMIMITIIIIMIMIVILVQHIQTNYLTQGLDYCDEDFRFNAPAFHCRILDETEANSLAEGFQDLLKVRDFTYSSVLFKDFRKRRALELRPHRLQRNLSVSASESRNSCSGFRHCLTHAHRSRSRTLMK